MNKKIVKRMIFIAATLIICALCLILFYQYYLNPYRGTVKQYDINSIGLEEYLTKEEALEDINFVVDKIKTRHYSSIKGLPKEVEQKYKEEINNLSETPTTLEVLRAAGRIINQLQDGHSQVVPIGEYSSRIEASFLVDNGITYILIDEEWREVQKINGVNMDLIYQNAKEQFSYENDYYFNVTLAKRIRYREYLHILEAGNESECIIEYSIEDKILTLKYPYIDSNVYPDTSQDKTEFIWYVIDQENNGAVLTLKSCYYNDKYKETLKQFFIEVENNHITNIALDLRDNGGGNSMVANEFIKYLKVESYLGYGSSIRFGLFHIKNKNETIKNKQYEDYLYDGKVYVLTSQNTFSSATMFSVYLQDNELAKVIGEPSGNRPSAYGDVISFQLPNTKLAFTTTYKYFHRPDITKDSQNAQIPDYPVASEEALEMFYQVINEESVK